jgi:hypothetical protein
LAGPKASNYPEDPAEGSLGYASRSDPFQPTPFKKSFAEVSESEAQRTGGGLETVDTDAGDEFLTQPAAIGSRC